MLCDKIEEEIDEQTLVVEDNSPEAIEGFLKNMEEEKFTKGIIVHTNFEVLQSNFFGQFTPIEAAGGIVENYTKEILFIYRLGKWDLPKGKVEADENIAAAALREVEEETGLTNMELKNKIGETYHTYKAYDNYFIKTTHWFYITCLGNQILQPQLEEDIEEAIWVKKEGIGKLMGNTYPSIGDILDKFFDS